MNLKEYQTKLDGKKIASVESGQVFKQIVSINPYTFNYEGKQISAIEILTDNGTFKTTATVLIKNLSEYFTDNKEPLENIRIVETKGKSGRKYLDMESSV